MIEVVIDGETKKVACGPCIRGHRSAKCKHKDRVLIEIRRPGRPLRDCPHINISCGCQRAAIHYTIPNASAEPSPHALPVASVFSPPAVSSGRVQKSTSKKPSNSSAASNTQNAFDRDPAFQDLFWNGGLQYNTPIPLSAPDNSVQIGTESKSNSMQPSSSSQEQDSTIHSCCQGNSNIMRTQEGIGNKTLVDALQTSLEMPAPTFQTSVPNSFLAEVRAGTGQLGSSINEIPSSTFADLLSEDDFEISVSRQGLEFINQLEKQCVCSSTNPSLTSSANDAPQHECRCGHSCACLGCATHPSNRTTIDYVRYHDDLLTSQNGLLPQNSLAPTLSQPFPHHQYVPTLRSTLQPEDSSLTFNNSHAQSNHGVAYGQYQQFSSLEQRQLEGLQNLQQFTRTRRIDEAQHMDISRGSRSDSHHDSSMHPTTALSQTSPFPSYFALSDVLIPPLSPSTFPSQEFWATSGG